MSYTSQTQANASGAATTVTCSRPGSVVAGTQLVAILTNIWAGSGALGAVTPPSGWVQQAYGTFTSAAGLSIEGWIFTHTEGGTEPSNYTWNWANPTGGTGIAGNLTIYNMGATSFQLGTCIFQGFEANVPITWSAAAQTATAQQVLTQIWATSNGTGQYSGMTRAAAENGGGATPYVASVSPGAVPTRTAASDSHSGFGVQGLVGFFATLPSAPSAPTLVSPIGGIPVDATDPLPFNQIHNSTDTTDANAAASRIKQSGAGSYNYVTLPAGTITASSPVWNALSPTVPDEEVVQFILPANTLSNGHTYNWSAADQESAQNLQGPFAADATFITQAKPTLVVTGPTGTITTTTAPPATFTETLHAGSVQLSRRAVWESGSFGTVPGSGTPEFDSGTVPGTTLSVTPDPLDNSKSYRCFVMITQTGPQDSAWAHTDFDIDVTPPEIPILTAAPDTDPTTGEPRVALTVLGSDAGPLWTHANTVFQVQVSTDGGATYVDVRGAGALTPDSSDNASSFDYESPFGGEGAYYRARVIGTPVNPIISDWSDVTVVPLACDLHWVHDPLDVTSAIQIGIVTDDARTAPISQSIQPTIGDDEPVVTSDVRQKEQGSFTWVTFTTADRAKLRTLLNSGRTLLARFPQEQDQQGDLVYFFPTGPLGRARYAQAALPGRTPSTAWVERSRP